MTTSTQTHSRRQPRASRAQRQLWDRRLLFVAVLALLAAWLYGFIAGDADVRPLVDRVLPASSTIEKRGELFIARDRQGDVVGYAATGEAPGYGGPITLLVGVDPAGEITGVEFVAQRESPGFFRLLQGSSLLDSLSGRTVSDPLQVGQDLDAVTGATISAEGVARAVRLAVAEIAAEGLNRPRPAEQRSIEIGVPEVALLLLFAAGYAGHRVRNGAWKRRTRWATLLGGMVVLGFLYTAPLTITMVISLLSGYWPDWHNNLYWYLLIGGILFVTTVDAKNPYCYWFCPFGAVQECLATISGAKYYRPRRLQRPLQWLQRGLALAAIGLGLALRRPGVGSYEPFATLFDFRGTTVQWALLALILLASLAVYRPFCNYLCPLDPVVDAIAAGRRWAKDYSAQWRKQRKND